MPSLPRSLRDAFVSTVAALALAFCSSAALAQTAAPSGPLPLDSKPDCGEKPDYPGKLASENQRRTWTKTANAYVDCLKKYVTAKQDVAQQYMKSANDAIDSYNATIKEFEAAGKGEN